MMVIGVACHPSDPGSTPVLGLILILTFICLLLYVVFVREK